MDEHGGAVREHLPAGAAGAPGDRFATYDAGTLKRTRLFPLSHWPRAEVFRNELWATMPGADAIDRFDARTGDRISFDASPVALNFEPSGRAWVGLESGALPSVDVPSL